MNKWIERHETVLRDLVLKSDMPAERIKEAILYSLFPGGKRLRPHLVYLCGELFHINPDALDTIAAAIELTHAYSLIHDDLPAMDNDDFRRGKPSCHRAFDEATAILVGDGMQALAIDILLMQLPKTLSPIQTLNVTRALVKASGPQGMISGQSLDLSELLTPSVDETTLLTIHHLKTGQLILACINMVLQATQPTTEESNALQGFAEHFGLAFQMQDDYLDKYDEINQLGKSRSSDLANNKTTFATLYTQEKLLNIINQEYTSARNALNHFNERASTLTALLLSLQSRTPFLLFHQKQEEH